MPRYTGPLRDHIDLEPNDPLLITLLERDLDGVITSDE